MSCTWFHAASPGAAQKRTAPQPWHSLACVLRPTKIDSRGVSTGEVNWSMEGGAKRRQRSHDGRCDSAKPYSSGRRVQL